MILKLTNLFILVLFTTWSFGQEQRISLNGIVQKDSLPLPNVNIINQSSNKETTSFRNGYFNIDVKLGDTLLFSALNHISRKILISNTHIANKTIHVYLDEGFNDLDEVMLIEKFRLEFGNMAVPEGAVLDIDSMDSISAPNMLKVTDPTRANSSVNFVSLLKSLRNVIWRKKIAEKRQLKEMEAEKIAFLDSIGSAYKVFFTRDLDIENHRIYEFIDYCQDRGLDDLYEKEAIEVMNFFVLQSREFNNLKE